MCVRVVCGVKWGIAYLTLVVNCTCVLMISGFCGWVGMQGCFSTTKELHTDMIIIAW